MKYDNVKKRKKRDKLVMCFVVAPFVIMLFFVLPLVITDFFRKPDILFAFMMVIGVAVLFVIFITRSGVPKRLKRMCLEVSAVNDAAMNELLERAVDFDGKYFVTQDHFIDFEQYRVIPRRQIRTLECDTFKHDRGRIEYRVVIRYGAGETDFVKFRNEETRDALYRVLSYFQTDDTFDTY